MHEQRNLQAFNVEKRRALPIDVRSLRGRPAKTVLRVNGSSLGLDPFARQAMKQIGHRHHRHRRLERRRIPEDRQQRDHAAVAPADDADARRVHEGIAARQRAGGADDIVDFGAAIVDGVIERFVCLDGIDR